MGNKTNLMTDEEWDIVYESIGTSRQEIDDFYEIMLKEIRLQSSIKTEASEEEKNVIEQKDIKKYASEIFKEYR